MRLSSISKNRYNNSLPVADKRRREVAVRHRVMTLLLLFGLAVSQPALACVGKTAKGDSKPF